MTNCPAVNQTTVAEHVCFIAGACQKHNSRKQIHTRRQMERMIGIDLAGKTLGVMGTGNVGKEVIKRALAFGMKIIAFDKYPDKFFIKT